MTMAERRVRPLRSHHSAPRLDSTRPLTYDVKHGVRVCFLYAPRTRDWGHGGRKRGTRAAKLQRNAEQEGKKNCPVGRKQGFSSESIMRTTKWTLWSVLFASVWWSEAAAATAVAAADFTRESGVTAGLAVVAGTTDGDLEAGLAGNRRLLVHGLALSDETAIRARRHLLDKGVHGQATVSVVSGVTMLPYADNLVNLLIVTGVPVTTEEALRILAPYGIALFLDRPPGAADRKIVKPWPAAFDEWSHQNHGPNGNPASRDTAVGPPRHMQWVAGPLWSRTHDSYPSVGAQVTAGGRIFYILDEGPAGVIDSRFPDRWALYARDAFNGAFLWRVPVRDCFRVVYQTEKTNEVSLIKGPWGHTLKGRLVAQRDLVFVKLGSREPLVALDAVTGEQRRVFPGTEGCGEFAAQDGVLIAGKYVFDANNGKVLWENGNGAIDGDKVFQYDGRLRCLELRTGKERWGKSGLDAGKVGALIATEGRVFLLGKETIALSQVNGELLWRKPIVYSGGGNMSPFQRPYVAGGRLWSQAGVSFDIETGEDRRTIPLTVNPGHHYRCYGAKASGRFVLTGKRGIEFHDMKTGASECCDWVRPTCGLGFMPANGMVYFPPHPCFCYIGEVLYGFYALAPEASPPVPTESRPESERLRQGGPFKQVVASVTRIAAWPTYRHDGRRSGSTDCRVPADARLLWRTKLGGRLTAPTAADGRIYVGLQDAAVVVCMDSSTGNRLWTFGCGGRVDTPPTLHEGLAIFGCTDGWVYAVRAQDGVEAWRFRVAPLDRMAGGFGRLESAWPVKGSVLVQDGKAYAIAGRSSYLDGGIVLVALDPATGRLLREARISHKSADMPVQLRTLNSGFAMEGALPEIPIGDGERVYMRQYEFDENLAAIPIRRITKNGDSEIGLHLMSTSDLLDDSGFNRTY
jgi:outer membrane protein assembly factor BamB